MNLADQICVAGIRTLFEQENCPFHSLENLADEQVLAFIIRIRIFGYPEKMDAETFLGEVERALRLTAETLN